MILNESVLSTGDDVTDDLALTGQVTMILKEKKYFGLLTMIDL